MKARLIASDYGPTADPYIFTFRKLAAIDPVLKFGIAAAYPTARSLTAQEKRIESYGNPKHQFIEVPRQITLMSISGGSGYPIAVGELTDKELTFTQPEDKVVFVLDCGGAILMIANVVRQEYFSMWDRFYKQNCDQIDDFAFRDKYNNTPDGLRRKAYLKHNQETTDFWHRVDTFKTRIAFGLALRSPDATCGAAWAGAKPSISRKPKPKLEGWLPAVPARRPRRR